jgi:hypothetical protein
MNPAPPVINTRIVITLQKNSRFRNAAQKCLFLLRVLSRAGASTNVAQMTQINLRMRGAAVRVTRYCVL